MTDIFPVNPLYGWVVTKSPKWYTVPQRGVSGREARVQYQTRPMWTWELTYEILRDKNDSRGPSSSYDELRTIMGFFLKMGGSFTPFFFTDTTDNAVVGQGIGTGDGAQTTFQLIRTMNGFDEPMTAPNAVTAVKFNGVTQSAGIYSIGSTGLVTFSSPPGGGVVITANFSYYFQVRFDQDSQDFENFMIQLWRMQSLKLTQVF